MESTAHCSRLLVFWLSEAEKAKLQETERKTFPDKDTFVVNSSYLCLSKNPLLLWASHKDLITHHQTHQNILLG